MKLIKAHGLILVFFFLISLITFLPALQDKVLRQGDVTSWESMAHEAIEYNKVHREPTLWSNSMFGGMPLFQTVSPVKLNLLAYVDGLPHLMSSNLIARWFGFLVLAYLGLLFFGISPWVAAFCAYAITFNTGNLTILEAGHLTKLQVLEYATLFFVGVLLVFRGRYVLGIILYTLSLGIQIYHNHVQMTYFLMFSLMPFIIVIAIEKIKQGEIKQLLKSIGLLVIGSLFGLLSTAGRMITTQQYVKDSMRGGSVLQASSTTGAEVNQSGLQWDYAMQWSNGWGDIMAGLIPGVVGGGSGEKTTANASLKKSLIKHNISPKQNPRISTYFGDLPFTSGPFYFGAVCLVLLVFGSFYIKSNYKWCFLASILFTILMSMGKNFAILNQLLFDYFPLFDKFRTPNSILVIPSILIPFMAAWTVNELVTEKLDSKRFMTSLKWSVGLLTFICLFVWMMGATIWDTSKGTDAQTKILADLRLDMMRGDALRSLLYILGAGILLYVYSIKKISNSLFIYSLGGLMILDIALINGRYLGHDDFGVKQSSGGHIARPVDQQILEDKSLNYRVMDNSIDLYNSASTSYFHKTIGGYHPAKLRRYQDLIDHCIEPERQTLYQNINKLNSGLNDSAFQALSVKLTVLNALNTKYFIFGQPGKEVVIPNAAAYGNAWFVKNIKWVASPDEEIKELSKQNLKNTVILHEEYKNDVGQLTPSGEGTITLTKYLPNQLEYQTESGSDQLAVFSEIWYGPNKGWEVTMDGNKVDHMRANYTFRSMKIPSGKHRIIFTFRSKAYAYGEYISLFASLSIILFSGWALYRYFKFGGSNKPGIEKMIL